MRSNRSTQSQRTNDFEWSMQLALNLGLPQVYVSMLDIIIARASSHCYSVILYGSWAEKTFTEHSDLDLLFVTKDENDKTIIMNVLESIHSETGNSVYDCKVLSTEDIRQLSNGPQHFAVWLMLTTGVVLNGSDLKYMAKLDHERVRTLINELLERINDSILSLESNIHFTGTCVQIAYITRTLYFIEKHLFKNGQHPRSKREYIKQLIGPLWSTVERIYSEVALRRKSMGKLEVTPRVKTRKGLEYSAKQYKELCYICMKLEETTSELKSKLQSVLELP